VVCIRPRLVIPSDISTDLAKLSADQGEHCIPLRRQYPVEVHALERLQNQGDDKAGQFLASIMRFQKLPYKSY
jgi:hypothetical protein